MTGAPPPEMVQRIISEQIRRRARLFLECAIENALAVHDGDASTVDRMIRDMLDHLKQ